MRRFSAMIASVTLTTALLSGCGGNGVNCDLDSCKVTLDRGVDASTSVLGVEVKLISVQGSNVTLDVGGNTFTVPVGEESDGIRVDEVTADKVVVDIPNGLGG